jgi:hypothetical protein
MSLLEVLVAVAVLATGVVAMQRLLAGSVAGLASDGELTRALLLARSLLADAEVTPPEPGHTQGSLAGRAGGRTPHDGLRQVRVRVYADGPGAAACELVELVRVPTS